MKKLKVRKEKELVLFFMKGETPHKRRNFEATTFVCLHRGTGLIYFGME